MEQAYFLLKTQIHKQKMGGTDGTVATCQRNLHFQFSKLFFSVFPLTPIKINVTKSKEFYPNP